MCFIRISKYNKKENMKERGKRNFLDDGEGKFSMILIYLYWNKGIEGYGKDCFKREKKVN